MNLIYIAGPYRAESEYGVKRNIDRAEAVALKYWKSGNAVFCPHKNSGFMGGACPDEIWLKGGLEILKRCDVIVMMAGWESSEGSREELRLAKEMGLEVLYELPDLHLSV